ncbi:MAG: DUF523 and DUF1722 domain-containing protein [Candidatus Eisenbacteria bacterium]
MGEPERLRIGISSCLLGQQVRFDGGHKRDRFLTDILGGYAEWVPVCPEVDIGLGTPRESIRIVRAGGKDRLVGGKSGADHTEKMTAYSKVQAGELAGRGLHGYVLKKDSPSCGMERVRVYDENGVPAKEGAGFFARALMERLPLLPVEEEGRLRDPRLRENFITRVFAYARWLRFRAAGPRPKDLVAFHTAHKMLVLAHSPQDYAALGRLVAKAGTLDIDDLLGRYEMTFMAGLRRVASPGRHVNVLQHFAGFLKEELDGPAKGELHQVFADYKNGYVPLVTPLTLLHHHLKRLGHEWVDAQIYLEPYPRELALRSSI